MDIRRVVLVADEQGHGTWLPVYCLRAMIDLAEVRGIRPPEISSLRPGDVDLCLRLDDPRNAEKITPEIPTTWWLSPQSDDDAAVLAKALANDRCFVAQFSWVERLRAAGAACEWLPYACQPEMHAPWPTRKSLDVCCLDRPLAGAGAAAFAAAARRWSRCYSGEEQYEEAARILAASLCAMHWPAENHLAATPFEALAAGSLCALPRDSAGLAELFQAEKHLVTFADQEELLDKLGFYLKHDEARTRITSAGRRLVLELHTYRHRLQQVLARFERRTSPTVSPNLPRGGSGDSRAPESIGVVADQQRGQEHPPSVSPVVADDRSMERPAASGTAYVASGDRPRLSLCMIARDNERTLGECLASIRPWVDEMIVVDTGSKDGTAELARSFGAQVFRYRWCDDFSAARNESLRHAHGEWLFWMDSDDTIDAENGRKLRALARQAAPPGVLGYVVQVHCPNVPRDGGTDVTVVDHVKLLLNVPELRFEGRIHEQVLPALRRLGGQVAWSDVFVRHSGADLTPDGLERKIARDLRILHAELRERPEHPFTLFNLGMTYAEKGEPKQAIDYLQRSLAVAQPTESHVRKAYALLVSMYAGQEAWEEAWNACFAGLQVYPSDAELLFRAGGLQQRLGRPAEAAALYERVLHVNEERHFTSIDQGILGYKLHYNLATVFAQLGRYREAGDHWRRVIAERPRSLAAWRGLAEVLLQAGQAADLEREIDRLRSEYGEVSWAALLEAQWAEFRGDLPAARRALDVACAADDRDALECRSQFSFQHGSIEEARAALVQLIARDPENAAALHNLGTILLRADRPQEAVQYYENSLRLRPRSALTYLHLGHAHAAQGAWEPAVAAWQTVCALATDQELAREAETRIREAIDKRR